MDTPFTDDEGLHGPSCFNVGFADSVHSLNLYLSVLTWVSSNWFLARDRSFMPHLLRIPESQRHPRHHGAHNTKGYQLFPERTRELTTRAYVTPSSWDVMCHSLFFYISADGCVLQASWFLNQSTQVGFILPLNEKRQSWWEISEACFGKGGPASVLFLGKTGYSKCWGTCMELRNYIR